MSYQDKKYSNVTNIQIINYLGTKYHVNPFNSFLFFCESVTSIYPQKFCITLSTPAA